MVLRSAIVAVLLTNVPASAASRDTLIAMAVGLLDVVEEHCVGDVTIDKEIRAKLFKDFREYDIGGISSAVSRPLNQFYEEFLHQARKDRRAFCASAPAEAARTGYPVIVATEVR